MSKQLPPRHPATGRFTKAEQAKANKSTSSGQKPPAKQAPGKSEGTRKA